jgi:diguanylate cyclase (GGDEF)-like protein
MAATFDHSVNLWVRLCLFWAAMANLLIAQLLLPRSHSFYSHLSSGLLLVLVLVLQRYPVFRRWRHGVYGLLVLLFWLLVSYYAPLWHDASGQVALLGLLAWLWPLLVGAGFVVEHVFLTGWTVAWGTLIVLAWSVQAPSVSALQAPLPEATIMATLHVVMASLSSLSLGMIVAHYRQGYQKLLVSAGRDYLTGLVNRGRLYELLRQEMARATRKRRPLSLIFYDIDNFGMINKEHGHPIGDRVLRTFSQQVQDQLRDDDHLGRWGGEEFMAIIPETSLEDTHYLAERLRETLATTFIAPVGVITASFGVVTWHPDDTIESLLSRLDVAVRDAKWQGKTA